jgi:zinc protease
MQQETDRRQLVKVVTVVFCLVVVPLILLLLAFIRPATAQTAKHYTDLTYSPLPALQIPPYSRFQLANGMVVYLMEDHELPLVGGTAYIRTGDRWEPADKVGLAGLTGAVLRSGGTQSRTADQLNQLLERRAAAVETGINETVGTASFNTLTEDLDQVFGVFSEILQQPAFAADKLAVEKNKVRGAIARRNDDPGSITTREFQKLIYGSENPYARTVEYATLDNIEQPDLVRFYQQYFHPNNIILGIVGDFDSKKMRQLVEAKLGSWQPNPNLKLPDLPAVSQVQKGGVFLVNQPQLTQSNVQIGHLGGQFDSPDYAALSVMNGVLNGFGGRLFNEVRSRQGLAYSVYAVWNARFDYPGVFAAGGQTRSEATVPFVKSILSELEKIRTQPVSAAELAYAKDSTLNSFIFNFQSPSQTLSRLLRYEYYGYPADFIFRYQKAIAATTIADVQRVAQTHLQPEKLVTLVVGNQAQIKPALTNLTTSGKVTAIDITIPPPSKG